MSKTYIPDTIFAPATAPGRSGVAVVRVSGPGSWDSARALGVTNFEPRRASLVNLRGPDGALIDKALVLPFKGPASFTGEDIVEYHIHGGRAVLQSLLQVLGLQQNHRPAEPGEFTRRAFENGKLDLTEAEAIADLVNAETAQQKAQALAQIEGSLSRLYRGWTEKLKNALAHLEADLEFPDEDLPDQTAQQIYPGLQQIAAEIALHLDDNRRGERLREGIHVAVIGAPNAGKSSLVNALAQRDVAIVADMPGTTRDIIEVHLDIGGYPVILADTAGLRPEQVSMPTSSSSGPSSHEAVEAEGIRRALERARLADIKLLVFDGTETPDPATLALVDGTSLLVSAKADRADQERSKTLPGAIPLSARTGAGLDVLLHSLQTRIETLVGTGGEAPALTRARHRAALQEAHESLLRVFGAPLPELAAEDVRLALRSLGRITGRVDIEELLDVVFRDFCIGK